MSRIANFFPERLVAYAFFSVGYYPPDLGFDYMKQVQLMKDLMGMEYMGYMEFFDSDAAAQIIEEHVSCS